MNHTPKRGGNPLNTGQFSEDADRRSETVPEPDTTVHPHRDAVIESLGKYSDKAWDAGTFASTERERELLGEQVEVLETYQRRVNDGEDVEEMLNEARKVTTKIGYNPYSIAETKAAQDFLDAVNDVESPLVSENLGKRLEAEEKFGDIAHNFHHESWVKQSEMDSYIDRVDNGENLDAIRMDAYERFYATPKPGDEPRQEAAEEFLDALDEVRGTKFWTREDYLHAQDNTHRRVKG